MENYGVGMFAGMFDEYCALRDRRVFDLLFMSHVLEHIVSPFDFLKQASEFAGRYVFIDVPCFDYKLRDEPFGMMCDEHVNLFTLEAIGSMMTRLGFGLVKAQMNYEFGLCIPAGSPAIATLWERGTGVAAQWKKPVITAAQIIDGYAKWSFGGIKRTNAIIDGLSADAKIGVFGVSNHTWKLLGYSGLAKINIVKFYDSDIRKHNIRMLGRPVQPFDGADVADGVVDTIIISAYPAQNSIAEMLKPYENKAKIVKLYEM
jgi:hypothetical protein